MVQQAVSSYDNDSYNSLFYFFQAQARRFAGRKKKKKLTTMQDKVADGNYINQ